MDDVKYFFLALFVMAGITYLVRMLPFVLFRKKIKNNFLKSFFYYPMMISNAAFITPQETVSTV